MIMEEIIKNFKADYFKEKQGAQKKLEKKQGKK